jgi:phosphate/sulfate permease
VGRSILGAWVMTLPATMLLGAVIFMFTKGIK